MTTSMLNADLAAVPGHHGEIFGHQKPISNTDSSSDIRNPQNAAWLAGFRYAQKRVFM